MVTVDHFCGWGGIEGERIMASEHTDMSKAGGRERDWDKTEAIGLILCKLGFHV